MVKKFIKVGDKNIKKKIKNNLKKLLTMILNDVIISRQSCERLKRSLKIEQNK